MDKFILQLSLDCLLATLIIVTVTVTAVDESYVTEVDAVVLFLILL